MISGYIFGFIWGKDCVYLFNSHSKGYEGNISQNGSTILMKFVLGDLQDYIKLIYYSTVVRITKHSIFRCNSSVLDVPILEKALNQN